MTTLKHPTGYVRTRLTRDSETIAKTKICTFAGRYVAERDGDELVIYEDGDGFATDRRPIETVADLSRIGSQVARGARDELGVERKRIAAFIGAAFIAEAVSDSELNIFMLHSADGLDTIEVNDRGHGAIRSVGDLAAFASAHYRRQGGR